MDKLYFENILEIYNFAWNGYFVFLEVVNGNFLFFVFLVGMGELSSIPQNPYEPYYLENPLFCAHN